MPQPTAILPDDWMPICKTCGKPMQLIDVRAKAAALGLSIPGTEEQYEIECCGYTLTIDDDEKYEKAIRNLKKHHSAGPEAGAADSSASA